MPPGEERFINVRKLAALDLVTHGTRLILAEFALSVLIGAAVGLFSVADFLRSPNHPAFSAIFALIALGIGLNYLPLLIYAIHITRNKSAQQEVAFELQNREQGARRYQAQSVLLVIPFAIFALAVAQERQKRQ